MNFCTLQDAYGVKTFKSPKVAKIGQKGKGLRGVHDTPDRPPQADMIGAPAGDAKTKKTYSLPKLDKKHRLLWKLRSHQLLL